MPRGWKDIGDKNLGLQDDPNLIINNNNTVKVWSEKEYELKILSRKPKTNKNAVMKRGSQECALIPRVPGRWELYRNHPAGNSRVTSELCKVNLNSIVKEGARIESGLKMWR